MSAEPDLGPLPRVDTNAELQEASVRALHALLKPDKLFILRDERYQDYGVDASLEVKVGGAATNFRSQVQLRAVGRANRLADGTIAKSVDVSNLNYLINGTSALYI